MGDCYPAFRCKFNPVSYSVGPLLSNVLGQVVGSGGNITISGIGFGTQCSGCEVLAYPGPISLQVSSWNDSAISALLPATFNGIAELVVQGAAGSDSITVMASPAGDLPLVAGCHAQITPTLTLGGTAIPVISSVLSAYAADLQIQMLKSLAGASLFRATCRSRYGSVESAELIDMEEIVRLPL
jgi:hypothetical protein